MKAVLLTIGVFMLALVAYSPAVSASDSTLVKSKATNREIKSVPATEVAPRDVADTSQTQADVRHRMTVYYFHGTQRCSNCIKIEAYTKEVMDSAFAAQLKDGVIVWRLINTDETANRHYRDDYQLYTKSLILSHLHGGQEVRWKNLDKIWEYLGDKAAFQAYIRDEVAAYLKDE